MSILSPDGKDSSANVHKIDLESDQRMASRWLLEKDKTGSALAAVLFMDSIEDWVLSKLEHESEAQKEEVRARQRRLSEILTQFRRSIPHDNYAFAQVLGWMKSSEYFYTIDYLSQHQAHFTEQFLEWCQQNRDSDQNAELALKRVHALYATKIADRVLSPENVQYVLDILVMDTVQ